MNTPWQQTIPIDKPLARELIESQFPGIEIQSFEYLGEGWDNKVYRVNGEWVFRFPRREECAIDCMHNEIAAMPHIARLLPTPVTFPVLIGQACDEYPYPFAGYHYLVGKPINETGLAMLPDSDFPESFGRFLKALHAIPLETIPCDIPHEPRKMDFERCSAKITEAASFLQNVGVERSSTRGRNVVPPLQSVSQRLAELKNAFPVKDNYCTVHGDLYSRHILMDGNKMSGIIDWGDMHPNTPAVDLSALYLLLAPEHHGRFWAEYGEVSETLQQQAQFRAIYLATLVCRYAIDVKDEKLLQVNLQGLSHITS